MNDAERFWSKVNKDGPVPSIAPILGPCWLWTAATQNGYGIFSITPTPGMHLNVKAHRFAYQEERGEIVNSLDHLCRVRHCVNPAHLDDVPMGVNNERTIGYRPHKTHCPMGHAHAENARYYNGYPYCRICDARKHREARALKAMA